MGHVKDHHFGSRFPRVLTSPLQLDLHLDISFAASTRLQRRVPVCLHLSIGLYLCRSVALLLVSHLLVTDSSVYSPSACVCFRLSACASIFVCPYSYICRLCCLSVPSLPPLWGPRSDCLPSFASVCLCPCLYFCPLRLQLCLGLHMCV